MVGVVTRLWAECLKNCGSVPGRGKRPLLQSNQAGSGFHLAQQVPSAHYQW